VQAQPLLMRCHNQFKHQQEDNRMKLKRLLLAVTLAFTTSSALQSLAAPADNLSGFDFNYSVDLNKQIGLTQVFDDGDRTYFQFTQAENLPTLYIVTNGKNQKITPEARPPYLIANGVAKKYALSTNGGKTTIFVSYNGKRTDLVEEVKPAQTAKTESAPVKPLDSDSDSENVHKPKKVVKKALKQNDDESEAKSDKQKDLVTASLLNVPFFENSISLSKKAKDDLTYNGKKIADAARVIVRGRPSVDGDDSIANSRALTIKNYLVSLGLDEADIETTTQTSIKNGKNQGFYLSEVILLSDSKSDVVNSSKSKKTERAKLPALEIKTGDLISTQLAAWAKRYNYTLQWDAIEYRATAPLTLNSPFNETLDSLITAMKGNDINLDVSTYENNVVRVVEVK